MSKTEHPSEEARTSWLDHQLPEQERATLIAHLAQCADCRSELESIAALRLELAALPAIHPSPAFVERVLAALPANARSTRDRSRPVAAMRPQSQVHLEPQRYLRQDVPATAASRRAVVASPAWPWPVSSLAFIGAGLAALAICLLILGLVAVQAVILLAHGLDLALLALAAVPSGGLGALLPASAALACCALLLGVALHLVLRAGPIHTQRPELQP